MSRESKGELRPIYLLCWRRCKPSVSPSCGRCKLGTWDSCGCGGGGLGAVAVMVGVDSASGGGSESTDLADGISHPIQSYEAQHEKRDLKAMGTNHIVGGKGKWTGT
jgi:hypothetical protein